MSAYESVVAALTARGSRRNGFDWQCPAHADNSPSLSVRAGKDRVLLHCQAGCATEDVVAALGLTMTDLFDGDGRLDARAEAAAYDYVDEHGEVLFQVVRFYPKNFRQRRPDGTWGLNGARRVLYRLPAVLEAARAGTTIYVVEGERDVHAIERAGGVATTNPGGAGKWRTEYSTFMANTNVIIVADKDEPGRRHAAEVARYLTGVATSVDLVEAVEGKDASDHLAAGHGLQDFVPSKAPSPPSATSGRGGLVRASSVRAVPVTWVRDGTVPLGNNTLLAGPPGLAKTTLLCEWSARASRGQLPGSFQGRALDAVIMSGEDSIESTLRPRVEAAGADLDRVHFVTFGDDGFALPDDLALLAGYIRDLPRPVLIGIDPVMAFVADRIDSHKDHHVRRVFSALWRFATAEQAAVVVVAHLNKSESRDFLARVNGSVGIGAAVRSALAVVRPPDQPDGPERVLVHVKGNLGVEMPTERFRVESRTTVAYDGRDLPTSGVAWMGTDPTVTRANLLDEPEERTERDEAKDWLTTYLADAPQLATDVIKAAKVNGISERTLKRARAEIGVVAEPVRTPDMRRVQGWSLRLPGLGGRAERRLALDQNGQHPALRWGRITST